MKKLLKHLKTLAPLGPKQADMQLSHFYSIFVQSGLHYVVIVSLPSPWLFKACLFHADSASVKKIIKFILQLLKVSSHTGMWGKQSFKASEPYTKTSVWVSRSLQPSSQSSYQQVEESFSAPV